MKIIIGLGNPGPEYQKTRHNAGIMLVDRIYEFRFKNDEYGFRKHKDIFIYRSQDLMLVKTAGVFMNESGKLVQELKYMNYSFGGRGSYELYLAHDDLDIKLGEYKIQYGVGPKVHNGVNSVEQALGTKDFWRVRIGIENRDKDRDLRDGEEYVLQRFSPQEREIINGVLKNIVDEILKADN